jgi:Family of unknown function (DUF6340)
MKISFVVLFLLLSVLILTSCTKIVYVSRKTDPEINIGNLHKDIVFINLFDYSLPDNVGKKNIPAYHDGVMNLLDGLSSFSSDTSFTFSTGDTLRKSVETGFLTTLLSADTIKSICNRYKSNLLLSLDSVSIFFDRDTVINSYFGARYRTINFYLNTNFFLSLYSLYGELIDRSEVDESAFYQPRTSGMIVFIPTVAKAREAIEDLAYQAGQDYVAKFYPVMIHDTLQLYTGRVFKESNDYIFAKNWKKALELLEQLAQSSDPAVATKARHNLEVVKEASEAD